MFLVGGHFTQSTHLTRVLEYDHKTKSFTELASFNRARTNFSLCSILGHLIYMVGGQEFVKEEFFKRDYEQDEEEEDDQP